MVLSIVISTYPNKEIATSEAERIVDARLAACVNMIQSSSVYRWQGKICKEGEIIVVFKTTAKALQRLQDEILVNHPYDTPEVVTLDAESSGRYMDWIIDSVWQESK